MSNTPKKRATRKPAAADPLPYTPEQLPPIPAPDSLPFEHMWLIKAATGIDVLDPPIRGAAIAACLWFACRNLDPALTWEQAKRYRLEDVELADDLDEGLPRDHDGEPDPEAAADPTDGSETPSNES